MIPVIAVYKSDCTAVAAAADDDDDDDESEDTNRSISKSINDKNANNDNIFYPRFLVSSNVITTIKINTSNPIINSNHFF